MASQPLFDNRYRYDSIYPRGRSGETLRALDTQDNNRAVVVKRPAPQDAPPLRAAQEVSIIAERKALERLSGHPSIPQLCGSGSFRAGGTNYQYLVMERATGQTLEDMVLELAEQNKRPPLLEMLAIIDLLLDALSHAHNQHVVYNDVDAKHLFWDRESYRLKIIDWGNAVLMDEVGHAPNISPATDIYQVGELLYFLYHGGARLASESDEEGGYRVHFAEHVPAPMQEIISRATHPNIKTRRYSNMRALREALNAYRQPILRDRDDLLNSVQSRLSSNASQAILRGLQAEIEDALRLDPAYPETRRLQNEIEQRLGHLAVQADFDAARIYLETGNWARAIHLIEELAPKADPITGRALRFLIAAAEQFQASNQAAMPADFPDVIDHMLTGRTSAAARLLMAIAEHDPAYRADILLIAERLAAAVPEIVLLPPHLARLEAELAPFAPDLAEQIARMRQPDEKLAVGISPLTDRYGRLAIQLADWGEEFIKLARQNAFSPDVLTRPADLAEAAAGQIVADLRQIAHIAYRDPHGATALIETVQAIDPSNKAISALKDYLQRVYAGVGRLADTTVKDSNGLLSWIENSRAALSPYQNDLSDPDFQNITGRLALVENGWAEIGDMLAMGRKTPALELLERMATASQAYNLSASSWLRDFAKRLDKEATPEALALNHDLAEALLAGYQAWDFGQAGRAADCARRAADAAQTDGERLGAERFGQLAALTSRWLNEGGLNEGRLNNLALTDEIEGAVFALFLPDERQIYERFSAQMPNEDVYLKTMRLGLVKEMQNSSSVAYRALFIHYSLRGVMEVIEGHLEAADFWRKAALNIHKSWATHPIFAAFDVELTRRTLILRAEAALNSVTGFDDLREIKGALNAPLAQTHLKDAARALTLIEGSLGLFADGDYRAVRENFNEASNLLEASETASGMELSPFKAWLAPYRERAAELVERKQVVEQAAMSAKIESDPQVLRALEELVRLSDATLGADYSRQVRLWLDLYRAILKTHLDQRMTKREKVAAFNAHFSALFIEKHPAYRLFQRWSEAAHRLPDDVEEDLQIDLEFDNTAEAPRFADDESEAAYERETDALEENTLYEQRAEEESRGGGSVWNIIIGLALLILVGVWGFLAYRAFFAGDDDVILGGGDNGGVQIEVNEPLGLEGLIEGGITAKPSDTPAPTDPPPPSATPTDIPPSATPDIIPTIAPTLTPSPVVIITTNTPPPTFTPAPTEPLIATDTPSAPPLNLPPFPGQVATEVASSADLPTTIGDPIDLLSALNDLPAEDYDWDAALFSAGAGDVWQLGAGVEEVGSAPIAIIFNPDFLAGVSPNAAQRLREVELDLELVLFDPARLEGGGVYFGIGLQNRNRQRYSAQVTLQQANVVRLGINENGRFNSISQIPLSPIELTLSLRRNETGSIEFFINGQRLGESPAIFALNEPVSIVLYNAGGGMFVNVRAFDLHLAPSAP